MVDRQDAMAGFTLLEILVALVVLGAVMAGLTRGTWLGIAAWGRQTALLGATAELDAVDRTLRLLLVDAVGRKAPQAPAQSAIGATGNPSAHVGFVGGTETLAFDATLPSAVAIAGRRAHVELLVDSGHRLVLRWSSLLASAATGRPLSGEATLLTAVRTVGFRYFGSQGPGKPAGWQDGWSGAAPPGLIRIHLAFAPGDGRHWPDIVVAPMTESGAH